MLFVLLLPGTAFALFFPADGQCTVAEFAFESAVGVSVASVVEDVDIADGCEPTDLDDPSNNACFEGAEVPISTLPDLIAQNQAERLGESLLARAGALLAEPVRVEHLDASITPESEDEIRLVVARPRPAPNSCTAASPDECHSAPAIPGWNLDGSSEPLNSSPLDELELRQAWVVLEHAKNPREGLGPADGHRRALERPPSFA